MSHPLPSHSKSHCTLFVRSSVPASTLINSISRHCTSEIVHSRLHAEGIHRLHVTSYRLRRQLSRLRFPRDAFPEYSEHITRRGAGYFLNSCGALFKNQANVRRSRRQFKPIKSRTTVRRLLSMKISRSSGNFLPVPRESRGIYRNIYHKFLSRAIDQHLLPRRRSINLESS